MLLWNLLCADMCNSIISVAESANIIKEKPYDNLRFWYKNEYMYKKKEKKKINASADQLNKILLYTKILLIINPLKLHFLLYKLIDNKIYLNLKK